MTATLLVKLDVPKMYPNKVDSDALEAKALEPTNGRVMLYSDEQPSKAHAPMLVTLLGTTMSVRFWHFSKDLWPMLVVPSPNRTLFKEAQLENA